MNVLRYQPRPPWQEAGAGGGAGRWSASSSMLQSCGSVDRAATRSRRSPAGRVRVGAGGVGGRLGLTSANRQPASKLELRGVAAAALAAAKPSARTIAPSATPTLPPTAGVIASGRSAGAARLGGVAVRLLLAADQVRVRTARMDKRERQPLERERATDERGRDRGGRRPQLDRGHAEHGRPRRRRCARARRAPAPWRGSRRSSTRPVRASAAGRWPCRTFSIPSGVTGMCVPSSIFRASSRAVT